MAYKAGERAPQRLAKEQKAKMAAQNAELEAARSLKHSIRRTMHLDAVCAGTGRFFNRGEWRKKPFKSLK
jgi:hypothetical protein